MPGFKYILQTSSVKSMQNKMARLGIIILFISTGIGKLLRFALLLSSS